MVKKSIFIWLSLVPLAILNGGLRLYVLEPLLGTTIANPISCIILCCLIFTISMLFIPRLGYGTTIIYVKIGLLWTLLTVVFETFVAIFTKMTFKEIINAYNIATGNFWIVVVLFIGFVPFLTAKISGRKQ